MRKETTDLKRNGFSIVTRTLLVPAATLGTQAGSRTRKLEWLKRLFGVGLLCATTAIALRAQTFTSLLSFDGADGANPTAGLVQAPDGNFYGTTNGGGTYGEGSVFQMTPGGGLTTIYSFCQQSLCPDGANPYGALVLAVKGDLYGTTSEGGEYGYGTVFKITSSGKLTTLHSFDFTDGDQPYAGLVQASNGDFYGTTIGGGGNASGSQYGTIFKITPSGTLTTLYTFCSQGTEDLPCTDGATPLAALIQATDGDLYGTTESGGVNNGDGYACDIAGRPGCGTVFKITLEGKLSTLYSFCSQSSSVAPCTDGANPVGGLVQASNGNFYGTTYWRGAFITGLGQGAGTVFEITPSGNLTTLYTFCSQTDCADGGDPEQTLVQGIDTNLYGTTSSGGHGTVTGGGVIFSINPNGGIMTPLYNFCYLEGCTDGQYPYAVLIQGTDGTFFGTTDNGGTSGNNGTVFSLSMGLGPFVETLPTAAKVGAAVQILGNSLTGTTSVTLNGTAAAFTVVSGSEITTSVPTGATAGYVQVVTPSGTLSSNVPFVVPPAATSTSLASSLNPSALGPVTFTATVTSTGGTPTGTVTFKNGSSTLGTGALSGGTATFTTSALSAGTRSITAVYEKDADFASSTSSALEQTVEQATSSTALGSSLNPSTSGQAVTFTAIVTSTGGTPTGTATFKNGSSNLGGGTLSGGAVTFTTSTLSVGTHSITAVYHGSTDFSGSTSSVVSQVVNQ